MIDHITYEDGPDQVRQRLQRTVPGDWFVFETFAADGSLAVGIARGTADPSLFSWSTTGFRTQWRQQPRGLARWHQNQGRDIAAF